MDYLFFDTESARGNFHKGLLCSFGYFLCDEKFEEIEKGDIYINPKSDNWERRVVKDIIAYNPSTYAMMSSFPTHYPKIKELLTRPDTMIINHGINNDVVLVAATIRRYNLEQVNYHFYDTALFYQKYKNEKNTKSLDIVSQEVCYEEPRDRHPSLEDAQRVFRIMRTLSIETGKKIEELFEEYPHCDGEIVDGELKFNREVTRVQREGGDSSISSDGNSIRHSRVTYFYKHLENLKVVDNPNSKYNGLKYTVDVSYYRYHFREMLYINKKMADLGATYVKRVDDSDIFIKNDINRDGEIVVSNVYKIALELMKSGKSIKIMDIADFLKSIDFDEDEVLEYYDKVSEQQFGEVTL